MPIAGMCNCQNNMDQDSLKGCVPADIGPKFRLTITILIIIAFIFALFTTWTRGLRIFLYKLMDDMQ